MFFINLILFVRILQPVISNKIHQNCINKLIKGEKVNALVYFGNGVKSVLEKKNLHRNTNNRNAQIESVVKELKQHAHSTQSNVISLLNAKHSGIEYSRFKQYWISNTVLVKDANAEALQMIADDSKVSRIIEEPKLRCSTFKPVRGGNALDDLQQTKKSDSKPCKDWNGQFKGWHFQKVKRDEAWKELKGNKGKDVIVATLSTGVQHTHESLKHNFRGSSYGWFDGVNGTLEPFDSHTYGTAITSIIAGSNDVGIAPDVTWISCRACTGANDCKIEHVLNCLQWMICPTLPDGSKPDCSMAPHVLSFSLCGDRTEPLHDDEFFAMSVAGIKTIAPVGDQGNDDEFHGCGHTCSPANSRWVIGVGGSTTCDRHKFHSSKGPAPDSTIKPDIVAPFDQIYAAESDGDSRYDLLFTGTSFSAPQVAGVVALLHVRNPNISFKEVYEYLTRNANQTIQPDVYGYPSCNSSFEVKPNIYVGFGRLDAYATLHAQSKTLKPKPIRLHSSGGMDFLSLD